MVKKITDIVINMPHTEEGPVDNRAGRWAKELLELGRVGDYSKLTDLLILAQERGCLSIIRGAAQVIALGTIKRKSIKRKTYRNIKAA